MSTHDQHFENDRYPEELPKLTLAEPKTATSRYQNEQADEQAEWSRSTDQSAAHTEPAVTRSEGSSDESDLGHEDGRHAETYPSSEPTESRDAQTESRATAAPASPRSDAVPSSEASLFADDQLAGLRARWNNVQAGFVDDPRECVHKADGLVSDVVGQLTASFTDARSRLEDHWGRGEEASTEDLRVALRQYRDFFERLLAV